jgi:hypothetical protein
MFERETEPDTAAARAVGLLTTAIDALAALDLTTLSRDELLGLTRIVEAHRRRLPVVDHRLVAELDSRGVAFELRCASTAALLRKALRLAPADAKARVSAAADLGARRAISGEALPPLFTRVAAAQAEGAISAWHAAVIAEAIDELPAQAQAEHAAATEERLVADARVFDPVQLCRLARWIVAIVDPDGTLADERRRGATLSHNGDGSGELRAHLTPTALAVWEAVLDPLAAPQSTDETDETAELRPNDCAMRCSTRDSGCCVRVSYRRAEASRQPSSSPRLSMSSRPGADSRRRATAGCCPSPTRSRSPPKPRSSRSFSPIHAVCCHTDAHAAPLPRGNGSRWSLATAAAPSPVVTARLSGRRHTMSSIGRTAVPPIWRT